MDEKNLIVIGIAIFILLAVGVAFLGSSQSNESASVKNYNFEKMPEECHPPSGQDVNSWIEHLGHHQETQYCLEYYK